MIPDEWLGNPIHEDAPVVQRFPDTPFDPYDGDANPEFGLPCPKCKGELSWLNCDLCGETGYVESDADDYSDRTLVEECHECNGDGGLWVCWSCMAFYWDSVLRESQELNQREERWSDWYNELHGVYRKRSHTGAPFGLLHMPTRYRITSRNACVSYRYSKSLIYGGLGMDGGNDLMLCPYCDGTPTIDEEPFRGRFLHCDGCDMDFGYGLHQTDEQLAQHWNEWVKVEMEERYEQAGNEY